MRPTESQAAHAQHRGAANRARARTGTCGYTLLYCMNRWWPGNGREATLQKSALSPSSHSLRVRCLSVEIFGKQAHTHKLTAGC